MVNKTTTATKTATKRTKAKPKRSNATARRSKTASRKPATTKAKVAATTNDTAAAVSSSNETANQPVTLQNENTMETNNTKIQLPGEIIRETIEARGFSHSKFAAEIGLLPNTLDKIMDCQQQLTAEDALLFEAALGLDAHQLLDMQVQYDLQIAKADAALAERLEQVKTILKEKHIQI